MTPNMRLAAFMAGLLFAAPGWAADVDQFEVLGLQLGDDLETVKATLAEQGFDNARAPGHYEDFGSYIFVNLRKIRPGRTPRERSVRAEVGKYVGLYKLEYIQERVPEYALDTVVDRLCQKYGSEPNGCDGQSPSGFLIWRDDEDLSKYLKARVGPSVHVYLGDQSAFFENNRRFRDALDQQRTGEPDIRF